MIHIINTISCWLITAFVPEYTRLESLTLPQMLNPNQIYWLHLRMLPPDFTSSSFPPSPIIIIIVIIMCMKIIINIFTSPSLVPSLGREVSGLENGLLHILSLEKHLKSEGKSSILEIFFQKMSIFATFPQPPFYDSCFCCCVFLPWGFSQSLSISSLVWNDHIKS